MNAPHKAAPPHTAATLNLPTKPVAFHTCFVTQSPTAHLTFAHTLDSPPRILQKLLLWATLVFFKRGSQLQMSGAVLLTTIRLVLHAHFEPYKDAMDNLFDYLTLIIVALNGMCGVLLQVRSACVHRFHLDCV